MATTGTNMFFQLKVRLNIHISLTGMSHQMVFIFCARILRSHFSDFVMTVSVTCYTIFMYESFIIETTE